MPNIRIHRARIDIGDNVSGLLFSYDPIIGTSTDINGKLTRISQVERFYIETPDGYELCVFNGIKFVRDPKEGNNVYMRAARVVSRYITMGESLNKRLLIVSHTDRDNRIRIISARLAKRRDRKVYEND